MRERREEHFIGQINPISLSVNPRADTNRLNEHCPVQILLSADQNKAGVSVCDSLPIKLEHKILLLFEYEHLYISNDLHV